MTDSKPKLRKGRKAFAFTKQGKFFHLKSTLLSPMYPQHAEAFKIAADMILDSHEAATRGPHKDRLLYPVQYLYRHCQPHHESESEPSVGGGGSSGTNKKTGKARFSLARSAGAVNFKGSPLHPFPGSLPHGTRIETVLQPDNARIAACLRSNRNLGRERSLRRSCQAGRP